MKENIYKSILNQIYELDKSNIDSIITKYEYFLLGTELKPLSKRIYIETIKELKTIKKDNNW